MPALNNVATSLRTAYGWPLVEDLTESWSVQATPVMRVDSEHGPAVLRVGIESAALHAYQRFAQSGLTPAVYASGEHLTVPWVLGEWIDGHTILNTPGKNPIDSIRDATPEVLAALRKLHTIPAPQDAQAAAVGKFTAWERHIAATMGVSEVPPLAEIARDQWAPAVLLHGDVLPNNVLRQKSGALRFIDLSGGFGPPEADAGRWVASRCGTLGYKKVRTLDRLLRLAVDEVDRVLAVAPWLDRRRLHSWAATWLCEYAMQVRNHGSEPTKYRGLVAMAVAVERHGHEVPHVPEKVGPNQACPCGSGKKFKRCCGSPASRTSSV